MKIVGIDTSTRKGSIALVDNGEVLARGELETRRQHSSSLFVLLEKLFRKAGWEHDQLQAVGAGVGPGSFTGIRIGLAAGEGLAAGLNIPLAGIVSFEALALSSPFAEGKICVLSDAGRGRLYAARYRRIQNALEELNPPGIIERSKALDFCGTDPVASPDWEKLASVFRRSGRKASIPEGKVSFPTGEKIAVLAAEKLKTSPEGGGTNPIYLSR